MLAVEGRVRGKETAMASPGRIWRPAQWNPGLRLWTDEAARLAILLFALSGALLNLGEQLAKFSLLKDAGYPDSYILYDIQHFQRTGVIYRDLSQPPSQPAQYSPMLYILLALPGRLLPSENPLLGPRMIVFAAYLLCVVVTASIAHAIIPLRSTWLWSILLGSSITSMGFWILQLRSDFLGILFELLAIRLLLRGSLWTTLIAGICVGLALLFKITMVAALAAGIVWLVLKRYWHLLFVFIMAGITTSGAFYLFFSLREPRMIQQMTTFSTIYIVLPIVRDLWSLRERISPSYIRAANERTSLIRATFWGRHIFSTIPYVAILDPQPTIIEPVLFAYLQRVGKTDPTPVMKSLEREEFAAVVTDSHAWSYRGIDKISPALRSAIITAYAPDCEFEGLLVHLPRKTKHPDDLRKKLESIDCRPVLCDNGGRCPPW